MFIQWIVGFLRGLKKKKKEISKKDRIAFTKAMEMKREGLLKKTCPKHGFFALRRFY